MTVKRSNIVVISVVVIALGFAWMDYCGAPWWAYFLGAISALGGALAGIKLAQRWRNSGPGMSIERLTEKPKTDGYYQLTVPDGADVGHWAREHWDTYGFDYEAWTHFPAVAAAVDSGQLIFWPLDDGCLDRLQDDGIHFERLDLTPDQLYAEDED